MAITNASDLLVYAKTSAAVAQITRIRVLTNNPIEVPDGSTNGTLKINNVTDNSGVVYDNEETQVANNTGNGVLYKIRLELEDNDYTDISGSDQIEGDYTYRDFENGANGIVPTLEIIDGTATLNENAVVIEILTPGSSAVYDPVAFSTQASFSSSADLRDVTTKDSEGYSESSIGLKSFEISTELLQSVNPDVPLDGTDFFHELSERDKVTISFSDRIRNKILTNLTQSGLDNFIISANITQLNNQQDPHSTYNASKLTVASGSQTNRYLSYSVNTARITDKKVNWSFYVKGSGSTTQACFATSNNQTSSSSVVVKIEGSGSVSHLSGSYWTITGLSTSTWTRVSVQTKTIDATASDVSFYLYPGLYNSQNADEIFTSSWQIELTPDATDYQDPTEIKSYKGEALVSSISFDAGVEDNLTCSATFTGTDSAYINGIGPELIGDPTFDNASYWTIDSNNNARVENGYGKIIAPVGSEVGAISKGFIMNVGDYYRLQYTIAPASPGTGEITIQDGWDAEDIDLPKSVGTHNVLIKAGITSLIFKRNVNPCDIWLSSISLKRVL